jgi:hypothetical protein
MKKFLLLLAVSAIAKKVMASVKGDQACCAESKTKPSH